MNVNRQKLSINRKLEITRIALQIIRDFEQLYDLCNEPEQIELYGKPTGYSLQLREIACERLSNVSRMNLSTVDQYVLMALREAYDSYAKRTETKEWIGQQVDKARSK